ncbi:unnamed protein product, partial [Phaeothamnion confervicola]
PPGDVPRIRGCASKPSSSTAGTTTIRAAGPGPAAVRRPAAAIRSSSGISPCRPARCLRCGAARSAGRLRSRTAGATGIRRAAGGRRLRGHAAAARSRQCRRGQRRGSGDDGGAVAADGAAGARRSVA